MRYLPEPEVNATTLPTGDLVLLNARSGKLYQGNSTSAVMWAALVDCGGDTEAAGTRVAETFFRTDRSQVLGDFGLLVEELVRLGMVRALS